MKIFVKFFAVDLPLGFTDCSFDMPENVTIEDVLDECLKLSEVNIEESYFKASMVLVNGERAALYEKVKDGDTLTVLRTLEGG